MPDGNWPNGILLAIVSVLLKENQRKRGGDEQATLKIFFLAFRINTFNKYIKKTTVYINLENAFKLTAYSLEFTSYYLCRSLGDFCVYITFGLFVHYILTYLEPYLVPSVYN